MPTFRKKNTVSIFRAEVAMLSITVENYPCAGAYAMTLYRRREVKAPRVLDLYTSWLF
jgi:hypothetical protein